MEYFLFLCVIFCVASARVLNDVVVPPPPRTINVEHQFTFFMQDVLTDKNAATASQANGDGHDAYSSPKNASIPLPRSDFRAHRQSGTPATVSSPFLTNLQVLEFGTVTEIDEVLRDGHTAESPMVGRVHGIIVSNSEGLNNGRMVAMTATFDANGQPGDSLKFFGLHHAEVLESHIVVIGGTGKYEEANGYATIRSVSSSKGIGSFNRSLLFTVALK